MTQKMRAWQVTGTGAPADVLHLVDVDVPEPGPGQARIRVTAAGIGLPDVLMCRGTYPLTPPLPFTPGQEATGTVTAVGEGVDLAIGAPVMGVTVFYEGSGSFAEECLVLAESAFAVPPGLAAAEAAGFWIPHLTGWIGLVDRGRIAPGDWLAVLGAAGGSGAAAVQLGSSTVVVLSHATSRSRSTSNASSRMPRRRSQYRSDAIISGVTRSPPISSRSFPHLATRNGSSTSRHPTSMATTPVPCCGTRTHADIFKETWTFHSSRGPRRWTWTTAHVIRAFSGNSRCTATRKRAQTGSRPFDPTRSAATMRRAARVLVRCGSFASYSGDSGSMRNRVSVARSVSGRVL